MFLSITKIKEPKILFIFYGPLLTNFVKVKLFTNLSIYLIHLNDMEGHHRTAPLPFTHVYGARVPSPMDAESVSRTNGGQIRLFIIPHQSTSHM